MSAAGAFPETAWSLILAGREGDDVTQARVRAELFGRYWQPLYVTARFGWRLAPEDAEDAVQGFLASLIERPFLQAVDPAQGRLRSFLKAALHNHLRNRHRDAQRAKRGGGQPALSLEGAALLVAEPGDPDEVFDAAWLRLVLERAVAALRARADTPTERDAVRVFEAHDLSPSDVSYAEVAARLDLDETAVRNRLHEARRRLRTLVLAEVKDYALDADDAAEEVQWILG